MRDLSEKTSASAAALREEADQAARRIESTLERSVEACRQQLAQITQAGLSEQKEAMAGNIAELRDRLRQAADFLVTVAPKAQ